MKKEEGKEENINMDKADRYHKKSKCGICKFVTKDEENML